MNDNNTAVIAIMASGQPVVVPIVFGSTLMVTLAQPNPLGRRALRATKNRGWVEVPEGALGADIMREDRARALAAKLEPMAWALRDARTTPALAFEALGDMAHRAKTSADRLDADAAALRREAAEMLRTAASKEEQADRQRGSASRLAAQLATARQA